MVSPNASDSSSGANVSPRKHRANRRNAKKSTGPRSKAGKGRAAMNATTHGIFCSRLVLAGEDKTNLFIIREGYLQKLAPQDIMELAIVDQIINAQWRMMRAQRAEADHLAQLQFKNREIARNKVAGFIRKYDLSNNLVEAEQNDEDRDDPAWKARYAKMRAYQKADDIDMPADALLCQAFMDRDGAIERMSRYEQRLATTITRCTRELERLRGTKPSEWPKLPPSPFLANPKDRTWPPDVIDDDELEDLAHKLRDAIKRMESSFGVNEDDDENGEEGEEGEDDGHDEHGDQDEDDQQAADEPAVTKRDIAEPNVQNEPTEPKTAATPQAGDTSVSPPARLSSPKALRTTPQDGVEIDQVRTAKPTEPQTPPPTHPKPPIGRFY